MNDKITIMKETFTNDKTGENVEGITIIVDGVLKQVLDKIITESNGKYKDYASVMQEAVFSGINAIINSKQ